MALSTLLGLLASIICAADWISVPEAKVANEADEKLQRSADGTSWFHSELVNLGAVQSAKWTVSGLGVFEAYVNGKKVGDDFLKPGYTHAIKTKYSFTYDVTNLLKLEKGASNHFAAEVGAGWWRDKIVSYIGKKSAFRGELEVLFSDGTRKVYGTNIADWKCGVAGPVLHSGIFDGEEYDARVVKPCFGEGLKSVPEVNCEFKGELKPTVGAEVGLRRDLAMCRGPYNLKKGETTVIDFGQNCAAVPEFKFSAKAGTKITVLFGEMVNDSDKGVRGCDGPKGSLYRQNLRNPQNGMRVIYTFAGKGEESYMPRFTFFGYRYVSLTATDEVNISSVKTIPVTSIKKGMEIGSIETGSKDVNQLISNVYWGQLSNYLSVPTDCPQRNERLGWTADTQVFVEAGSFNANTTRFFHKWMRDERDSQHELGGFPGVAPFAQYGNDPMRIGWADAGIIVPYQIWKQFGDNQIIDENWDAMVKFVERVNTTKYEHAAISAECKDYQWADWLSYEKLETWSGQAQVIVNGKRIRPLPEAFMYWDFLGGCYWVWDAEMMATIAEGTGRDAKRFRKIAADARAYMKAKFFATEDGMVIPLFRDMQTPALFALKLGLVEGDAKAKTIEGLKQNFKDHGDCLQTGFLGTSIIMDTLTENGMSDIAYTLLLQHKNPSWLYSVDQGATTIWERWNSYTKDKGFGPVGMNSFNHYAYGAVLAWIYKTAAGIAADPKNPGYRKIIMSPKPDRRIGSVKAKYNSAAGLIKSSWWYEGDKWIWEFTVPSGAIAQVTLPGESLARQYEGGSYKIVMNENK